MQRRQAKQGIPDVLLPSNTFWLLGDSGTIPGQMRCVIPPVHSGSTLESHPIWVCLEDLQREAPWRYPNQMPKPAQLVPFDMKEQWLYSELPPYVSTPHPISKVESGHSLEKTYLDLLYLQLHSFSHYPKLMTKGEGLKVI